jgi:hypothetical protein
MRIRRPIIIMSALFGASIASAIWFADGIVETWHHNPTANSAILAMFAVGLLYTLYCAIGLWKGQRQWSRLEAQAGSWRDAQRLKGVMAFFNGRLEHELGSPNAALRDHVIHSFEEVLNLRARLTEYMAGLLIGLGLLGTFLGLMATMGSIGEVLKSLNGNGGVQAMLESLSVPLSGMASAFSASLMGLLGSLLMGAVAQFMSDANDNLVQRIRTWSQQVEANEGDISDASASFLEGASSSDTPLTVRWNGAAEALEVLRSMRDQALDRDRAVLEGFSVLCLAAKEQSAHQADIRDATRESARQLLELRTQIGLLTALGETQLQAQGAMKDALRGMAAGMARAAGSLDENRVAVGGAVRGLSHTLAALAQASEGAERKLDAIEQAMGRGAAQLALMTQSVMSQQDASLELVRRVSSLANQHAVAAAEAGGASPAGERRGAAELRPSHNPQPVEA